MAPLQGALSHPTVFLVLGVALLLLLYVERHNFRASIAEAQSPSIKIFLQLLILLLFIMAPITMIGIGLYVFIVK